MTWHELIIRTKSGGAQEATPALVPDNPLLVTVVGVHSFHFTTNLCRQTNAISIVGSPADPSRQ
jgi:hypothetical protein